MFSFSFLLLLSVSVHHSRPRANQPPAPPPFFVLLCPSPHLPLFFRFTLCGPLFIPRSPRAGSHPGSWIGHCSSSGLLLPLIILFSLFVEFAARPFPPLSIRAPSPSSFFLRAPCTAASGSYTSPPFSLPTFRRLQAAHSADIFLLLFRPPAAPPAAAQPAAHPLSLYRSARGVVYRRRHASCASQFVLHELVMITRSRSITVIRIHAT